MQYEHYPVNPAYALGSGAGTGSSYGVFVSMPFFARYRYEGEIQRAEVDYGAALETLDKARAQAQAEFSRALSDLESAGQRLRRHDESLLAEAQKAADPAAFAPHHGT